MAHCGVAQTRRSPLELRRPRRPGRRAHKADPGAPAEHPRAACQRLGGLAVKPEGWMDAPSVALGATTLTQAVKYAGASGDFNPLHHDLEAARRAGFKDIIVHGSLNAARLAHVAETHLATGPIGDQTSSA